MFDWFKSLLTGNQQSDFLEPETSTGTAASFSADKQRATWDIELGGGTSAPAIRVEPDKNGNTIDDQRLTRTRQQLKALAKGVIAPHDEASDSGTLAESSGQQEQHETSLHEKESPPDVQWEQPKLAESELGEIIRTADRFAKSPKERTDLTLRIYQALANGQLENLTDNLWAVLENTDSFGINKGDLEKVRALGNKYGRDVEYQTNRIRQGIPIDAPTIAIVDNIAHKIGGNTRLMVTRAMGITPKVMIARLESRMPPEEIPAMDSSYLQTAIACYELLCRPNKNRNSFTQAYTQLEGIGENQIPTLEKLGEIYYNFDHTPTLEEFVIAAGRDNIKESEKDNSIAA